MEALYIITGLVIGFFITWVFTKNKLSILNKEKTNLDKEKSIFQNERDNLKENKENLETDLEKEQNYSADLRVRLGKKETENENIQDKLNTQKKELEEIQKKFTVEFQNIANNILKQNSKEFTNLNQEKIGNILNPLKERIKEFSEKVEKTHNEGRINSASLKTKIEDLSKNNEKLSKEANNLAKALKGESKTQGDWGEMILDRTLEMSGLEKSIEYKKQESIRNKQGVLIRPDVIILLPENRNIIVDSKVSLNAYNDYVNTNNLEEKKIHLKKHIESIKNHVKELSKANYQNTVENSLDFVLMFLPIAPSLDIALQNENDLLKFAYNKKVIIVTPFTLLATLKTIESLWRQEKQNKNAIKIAQQAGDMYDKFVSFLEDFKKVGDQIKTVQGTYDKAENKLSSGTGNLIKRSENIKQLGAKTSKILPNQFTTTREINFIEGKNEN
jgi:DNA recombination protein RmuC